MFYLEAFEAHPLTAAEGVALGCVKVMFCLSQPQSCQSWLRVGALKLVFVRTSEAASTSDAHMRNYSKRICFVCFSAFLTLSIGEHCYDVRIAVGSERATLG